MIRVLNPVELDLVCGAGAVQDFAEGALGFAGGALGWAITKHPAGGAAGAGMGAAVGGAVGGWLEDNWGAGTSRSGAHDRYESRTGRAYPA